MWYNAPDAKGMDTRRHTVDSTDASNVVRNTAQPYALQLKALLLFVYYVKQIIQPTTREVQFTKTIEKKETSA